ncbi:MAG: 23S rRNA (adenine(2503)-C(2))-methyltransferase RlmN [Deltaproteobacteria bacterium]|nr:23S rRNA (adenine(2503)-C(2))-methyltransferase RlmN [Deltaproteobacteria bacterium]
MSRECGNHRAVSAVPASTPCRATSPLAAHDRRSLAEHLSTRTGAKLDTCERTAQKALRLAFREPGECRWDGEALERAGIGAWARPTLLALSPRPTLTLAERAPSSDGTVRLLLRTEDNALVESVLIPVHEGRNRARTTLCISTQVGCARACSFCETGRLGLSRQLTAAEIVDQVRLAALVAAEEQPVDRRGPMAERRPNTTGATAPQARRSRYGISNVVFMGMGEPLDNLKEVLHSVALLTDDVAFAFAPSRVTVSTVGVVDKIPAFLREARAELAVSLHVADDARRSAIMPVNRKHDLAALRATLLEHLPRGQRILFQYTLFQGFNDHLEDADQLAEYVAPFRCRVNLIPANPGPDPQLVSSTPERLDAFIARLVSRGVTTLVRRPRGRDVGGACGQLAGSRRLEVLREVPTCS